MGSRLQAHFRAAVPQKGGVQAQRCMSGLGLMGSLGSVCGGRGFGPHLVVLGDHFWLGSGDHMGYWVRAKQMPLPVLLLQPLMGSFRGPPSAISAPSGTVAWGLARELKDSSADGNPRFYSQHCTITIPRAFWEALPACNNTRAPLEVAPSFPATHKKTTPKKQNSGFTAQWAGHPISICIVRSYIFETGAVPFAWTA